MQKMLWPELLCHLELRLLAASRRILLSDYWCLPEKRLNCKEDIDIVSLCADWLPFSQFLLFVMVGMLGGSVATWWSFEVSVSSVYW